MTKDLRTVEEHDCDRILYSSAFRRLAGVTQVVAAAEKQLFHTRLTHTEKVAQLAKRLAADLARDDTLDAVRDPFGGVEPAAAEAAALAHDLGHPPFGHIGESVLRERCDQAGIDGFEGNAQSFRIVTKLARHPDTPRGLGLSDRTLRGILKYPWLRARKDKETAPADAPYRWKKFGSYQTEAAELDRVLNGDGSGEQSPEATIMDWADDISYGLHDVEDFFRAGLIPLDRLAPLPPIIQELTPFMQNAGAALSSQPRYDPDQASRAIERLQPFFPATPYKGTIEDRDHLHGLTSQLILRFFSAVSLFPSKPNVRVGTEAWHEVALLKQMTWQFVVNSPALASAQRGQQKLMGELFDALTDWMKDEIEGKTRHRLPVWLQELWRTLEGDPETEEALPTDKARLARAAADYICCLTEQQTIELHRRLTGHTDSSMVEGWVRF